MEIDITFSLKRNARVVHMQCEGISHEASLTQSEANINCLNWTVGHIVVSRNDLIAKSLKNDGRELILGAVLLPPGAFWGGGGGIGIGGGGLDPGDPGSGDPGGLDPGLDPPPLPGDPGGGLDQPPGLDPLPLPGDPGVEPLPGPPDQFPGLDPLPQSGDPGVGPLPSLPSPVFEALDAPAGPVTSPEHWRRPSGSMRSRPAPSTAPGPPSGRQNGSANRLRTPCCSAAANRKTWPR